MTVTQKLGFLERWGKEAEDLPFEDRYYARMPGFIAMNYHKFCRAKQGDPDVGEMVGLSSNEFTYMMLVMAFKFDVPGATASPSDERMAKLMGLSTKTIQRIKRGLRKKGAMTIRRDESGRNNYVFDEVVRQCRIIEEAARNS